MDRGRDWTATRRNPGGACETKSHVPRLEWWLSRFARDELLTHGAVVDLAQGCACFLSGLALLPGEVYCRMEPLDVDGGCVMEPGGVTQIEGLKG